jgi:6-phosphogluconolactonase
MTTRTNLLLQIYPSISALGQAAAELVARLSAQAVEARGRFTVALSGGSLPGILCPSLVNPPLSRQIEWPAWHVFWADERYVPLHHPDSNFYLARQELFSQVKIPVDQVYPLDDTCDLDLTATLYQSILAQVLQPEPDQPPQFDLILLGMGDDGHTASLFPHHPLLQETARWVASVTDSPKLPPERLTLTLPVINNARHVIFIATGAGKATMLPLALAPDTPLGAVPAQMVQPAGGQLIWFIDTPAASRLKNLSSHS